MNSTAYFSRACYVVSVLSARKTKMKKHIPFPLGAFSLGSEVSHLYFRNVIGVNIHDAWEWEKSRNKEIN